METTGKPASVETIRDLAQAYCLALFKQNPEVHVTDFFRSTAYRAFTQLLSAGHTPEDVAEVVSWGFQDGYWKSRLGDPFTFVWRWNELSTKALASKKEKEMKWEPPRIAMEPVLLHHLWAIEKGDLTQSEAKDIAACAQSMVDFYRQWPARPLYDAILALSRGEDPKGFIMAYKNSKKNENNI